MSGDGRCDGCRGPKPPGRGRRYCETCRPTHGTCNECGRPAPRVPRNPGRYTCITCINARAAARAAEIAARPRRCHTCGETKPPGEYATRAAHRCNACRETRRPWNEVTPCQRCGGPRERGCGRGSRLCGTCRADADKANAAALLCQRCGEPKGDGHGRRWCDTCRAGRLPKPCLKCGARTPKPRGYRLCLDCTELEREMIPARRRARATVRRRPCRRCGRAKPPGPARQLCDTCRAARQACEGRPERVRTCIGCSKQKLMARGAKRCDDCKSLKREERRRCARERDTERRLNDPDYAKRRRKGWQAYDKKRRAERRRKPCTRCEMRPRHRGRGARYCEHCRDIVHATIEQLRQCACGLPMDLGHTPSHLARVANAQVTLDRIPSLPLAALIERVAAAEAPRGLFAVPRLMDGNVTATCDHAGTSERELRAWRVGERPTVSVLEADTVLTRLGRLWFDAYNDTTVRRPLLEIRIYRQRIRGNGRPARERVSIERIGDAGCDRAALAAVQAAFEGATEPLAVAA